MMTNWFSLGLPILTHFLFVLFATFSGFLIFNKFGAALLHLPDLLRKGWIELSDAVCSRPALKNYDQKLARQKIYEGDWLALTLPLWQREAR